MHPSADTHPPTRSFCPRPDGAFASWGPADTRIPLHTGSKKQGRNAERWAGTRERTVWRPEAIRVRPQPQAQRAARSRCRRGSRGCGEGPPTCPHSRCWGLQVPALGIRVGSSALPSRLLSGQNGASPQVNSPSWTWAAMSKALASGAARPWMLNGQPGTPGASGSSMARSPHTGFCTPQSLPASRSGQKSSHLL